MMKVTKLLAP